MANDDPSTTIPGGKYINTAGFWVNAEGQYIDAKGNRVDEPVKAKQAKPEAAPVLMQDELLAAAGFDTPEKIAAATDAELLAVEGVKRTDLKRIRAQ